MAIAIMLSITFIWLAVGFWGMWLAADPNFDKVNVPALLAIRFPVHSSIYRLYSRDDIIYYPVRSGKYIIFFS